MSRRRDLPTSFEELSGLRARGLVRESTVEQGDNSGPIVQRRDHEAFAERWGLKLERRRDPATGSDEPYVYTDLVSGSDAAKRPQFQQMVADAKAGSFDVLLVRETSRFARNRREAGTYEDQLHDAGVVVAYTYDHHLSSDRVSQIPLAVKQAVDEEYRLKLADNVQDGYLVKRFQALKFSGTPPIGYVMEYLDVQVGGAKGWERKDTGKLLPDETPRPFAGRTGTYTNAGLVRYLGEVYASGSLGARPLAALLNREGYRSRRGEPFTGNGIRHVLESPTYAGWLAWHYRKDKRDRGDTGELVQGNWEPLWPADRWEQIQAVRRRHWRGSAGGRMRNTYPLRQLAHCDRCGSRLYGEARDGVTYMACSTQRERHACDQRGVRTSVLEDQIGAWLATVHIPDDWRADVARLEVQMVRALEEPRPDERAVLTAELDRLRDVYVLGHLTREDYIAKRRAVEAALTGAPITSIAPVPVLERVKLLLDDLSALWAAATAAERMEICQTAFASVRVRDQVIVEAELARPEWLPMLASSAARAQTTVGLAPPDGSHHTRQTFRITGVDALVARLLAA